MVPLAQVVIAINIGTGSSSTAAINVAIGSNATNSSVKINSVLQPLNGVSVTGNVTTGDNPWYWQCWYS